jgi:hypothetical protein
MGRYSTGAYTLDDALEINISNLRKQKLLVKGQVRRGTLSWSRRGETISSIGIDSYYTDSKKYIRLYYTNTDRNGTKTDYDYKINLVEADSNLGKGNIVFFECPYTHRKCRKLYNAYGYQRWKSREGYENRLYYGIQIVSKFDRYNTRYWELDRQIENDKRRSAKNYNGKKTKRAIQNFILKLKRDKMDGLRWSPAAMTKSLRRYFGT